AASVTIPAGALSVGVHSIFAIYLGDVNFAGSQSTEVGQTVNLTATTTALVDNGPNPSTSGQAFSVTVTISPAVPDGETIHIKDASNGNAIVATAALAGGTTTFNISNLAA